MIVAITKNLGTDVADQLIEAVGTQGMLENVALRGDGCYVVSFQGGEALAESLSKNPLVERVHSISGPWGLVARESSEAKIVQVGPGLSFGGTQLPVIAGPCSVENDQILSQIAESIKKSGATGLRGGAFKPRTSPYAFQGLGDPGLVMLAKARRAFGLPVVTEVMGPDEVDRVAEHSDMLQIGSRNIQNFRLLEAVGRTNTPVLLKRGMMSTLDEFLGAAEYIYMRGNENIVLCERGIRSFEPRMRNTLDLGSVALLKQLTHLPVIVDPSHGTGLSELVGPMARAAVAVGADGLMMEVHPRPELAKSDGRQTLDFVEFDELMQELEPIAKAMGRCIRAPKAASAQA
ncbi:MAG: 3-deoxy-7-phosphoheptulonate synthase [Planctomycetota bacterium]|jgi:3-deoxy-7-phosphoheptulonate synthase